MAASKTPDSNYNINASMISALGSGMKMETGTIALDNSYPTGGESLTFFANTKFVMLSNKGGYVFDYDLTNEKIIAYYADNGYTVATSTVTPLVQFSSTGDLEALSDIPYFAIGWG